MDQIKKIKSRVSLTDFVITFEYDTKRHNHKSQQRMVTQTSKENAMRDFWIWINTENEDKPYRAMSNVKILDMVEAENRIVTF